MQVVNKLSCQNEDDRKITYGDVVLFEYLGDESFCVLSQVSAGELRLIGPYDNFNRQKDKSYSMELTVNQLKKELSNTYRKVEIIPRDKVKVTFELV